MMPKNREHDYLEKALENLNAVSRTAITGHINNDSGKLDALDAENVKKTSSDMMKLLIKLKFEKAYNIAFTRAQLEFPLFYSIYQVKDFIAAVSKALNDGIINSDNILRTKASEGFAVYTEVHNLNASFNNFCIEFNSKLVDLLQITDPSQKFTESINLAAWIHYRVNLTDHYFADGCGKMALILSYFVFILAEISPTQLPIVNYAAYYNMDYLPIIRRGSDIVAENIEWERWRNYFSAFFLIQNVDKPELTTANIIRTLMSANSSVISISDSELNKLIERIIDHQDDLALDKYILAGLTNKQLFMGETLLHFFLRKIAVSMGSFTCENNNVRINEIYYYDRCIRKLTSNSIAPANLGIQNDFESHDIPIQVMAQHCPMFIKSNLNRLAGNDIFDSCKNMFLKCAKLCHDGSAKSNEAMDLILMKFDGRYQKMLILKSEADRGDQDDQDDMKEIAKNLAELRDRIKQFR